MDLFGILEYVGELIIQFAEWVISVFVELWNVLVQIFAGLGQWLQGLWTWLGNVWQTLKDFFDDLWNVVIRPAIEKIQQIIDDITTWLSNFLDPIITFLQKLSAWYLHYIYPIVKSIIEVIQRMRVILALLADLHVKWAAKLDADLAKIQAYVTTAIQDVVGPLNQAITWLNIAIDPGQIIRKDFFTGTLFSSLGAVKGAQAFGQSRALTASEQTAENNRKQMLTDPSAVLTRNADGSVTYSQESQNTNAAFAAAVNYYGFPTGTP